jgi:hypothetical protein
MTTLTAKIASAFAARANSSPPFPTEIDIPSQSAAAAKSVNRRAFMNSIVALPIVAAVPVEISTPAIANQAIAGDVSFPSLVARFARLQERWIVQDAKCKAWSGNIDRLFFEATGVTARQLHAADIRDPRFQELQEIWCKIIDETPSDDPVNETGDSIAWNELNDELFPLAEAMLSRTPQSVADLGWQTEAILTAYDELRDEDTDVDYPMIPKLLKNIRALAGPLPIPNMTLAAVDTSDPIFAAIEAHKQAAQFHSRCVHEHNALETKLPREKRKSLYAWEIVETDDPQWISTLRAMDTSADTMHDLARAILEVYPTTPAGAAAVLNYIADGGDEDWMFPDASGDEGETFRLAVMRHVAEAFVEMGPAQSVPA